jgi:hypothetical protein
VTWGAYDALWYPVMDSIWDIGFPKVNFGTCSGADPKSLSNAKGIALNFGHALQFHDAWRYQEGVEVVVEVERRTLSEMAKYQKKENKRREKEQAKEDKMKEMESAKEGKVSNERG